MYMVNRDTGNRKANRLVNVMPTNEGVSDSVSGTKESPPTPTPDAPNNSSGKENKPPTKKGKTVNPTSIYKPSNTSTTAR